MGGEINFKSSSTVCFSSGYGLGRPSIVISYPASRSQGEALVAFHHPRWISCCGQKTRGRRSSRGISVVRTRLSRKSTPLSQDGRHHEHLRRRQGCQGPQGTHRASVASPSRSRLRHPSDGCRPGKIPPQQIKRTGFASLRGAVRARGRRAGIHPSFLDPSARRICDLSGRSRPAVSRSRSRPRRGNRRADAFSPR